MRTPAQNDMTFNLAIGLENIENPDATGDQPKTYAEHDALSLPLGLGLSASLQTMLLSLGA